MYGGAGSPTNDLPGDHIESHGHIEPAFPGSDRGDVGYPNLIRLRNIKVSLDQIWDELSWLASNIPTRSVSRLRSHPIFTHQPSDPMFATAFSGFS